MSCLQGAESFGIGSAPPSQELRQIGYFWNMNPATRPHECSLGPPPCHAGGRGFEPRPLRQKHNLDQLLRHLPVPIIFGMDAAFLDKAGVLSQRNQRLSVLNTLGGYSPRPMVCFGSWELLMRRATVYHLEFVNTPNGRADEQRR